MRDHTKLRAFVLADDVVLIIYRITFKFPKEEVYGLTSQMRRAAIPFTEGVKLPIWNSSPIRIYN